MKLQNKIVLKTEIKEIVFTFISLVHTNRYDK